MRLSARCLMVWKLSGEEMRKAKQKLILFLIFTMFCSTVIPMQVQAATDTMISTEIKTSVDEYAASKVKINKTKETVYVGSSTTLKITGTNQKITWSSSDKKVATVSKKGKVTAKKAGTATIIARWQARNINAKLRLRSLPSMQVRRRFM